MNSNQHLIILRLDNALLLRVPSLQLIRILDGCWQQWWVQLCRFPIQPSGAGDAQPGSAFKPFVYLAALDAGYSPTTRILDGPLVVDQVPVSQNGNRQITRSGLWALDYACWY